MTTTNTTTDDPKPCPLCGGEAKVGEYFLVDRRTYDPDNDWTDSRRWWHVVCTRCEVVLNNGWRTTGEAVWEWNQRPVHDELVASCRELVTACAALFRVISRANEIAQEDFESELLAVGVKDGFGKRAMDLLAKAEGEKP